ncbi:MAG: hypothetical protein JWO38_3439 [Gemmataceae bacterium]|nr:hypothetical protein [Gemmataceae bacterium]
MNPLLSAPDIQEEFLFLPRVTAEWDPLVLLEVQPLTEIAEWTTQRRRAAVQERAGNEVMTGVSESGGRITLEESFKRLSVDPNSSVPDE